MCVHCETCGLALALEHTGDVYSCDHFVEPRYLLGNISERHLADLVASEPQQRFGRAQTRHAAALLPGMRRPLRLPRRLPQGPIRPHVRRRARPQLPLPELQALLRSRRGVDAADDPCCSPRTEHRAVDCGSVDDRGGRCAIRPGQRGDDPARGPGRRARGRRLRRPLPSNLSRCPQQLACHEIIRGGTGLFAAPPASRAKGKRCRRGGMAGAGLNVARQFVHTGPCRFPLDTYGLVMDEARPRTQCGLPRSTRSCSRAAGRLRSVRA